MRLLIASIACACGPTFAQTAVTTAVRELSPAAVEFDPAMLAGRSPVDVRRFARGNPLLAGVFRVDVYVNGTWVARRDIRVDGSPAVVCFDQDLLRAAQIAEDSLTPRGALLLDTPKTSADPLTKCDSISDLAHVGQTTLDSSELKLDIVIPQAATKRTPRGYVSQKEWDPGVPALLLNYSLNSFWAEGGDGASKSTYLGLNAGANLDRWRFRHRGSFSAVSSSSGYTSLGATLSTDLASMGSTLTIGDTFTQGQLFDSVAFRGVSLSSDDRMLPASLRSYAPVIRDVVATSARVEVRQGGSLIHSLTVPPGPFEIDDLYPTGYGGDLEVTITESTGVSRVRKIAYTALPQLVRQGALKYALHAGVARGYGAPYEIAEASAQYGIADDLTVNAAIQGAKRYTALLGGVALNTYWGAFQANVAASMLSSPGGTLAGHSVDASWAKVFPTTRTNFSFAAYRYSSDRYYSLADALRSFDSTDAVGAPGVGWRTKNRAVLTLSQGLERGLHVYATASAQTYWYSASGSHTWQLGLSAPLLSGQVSLAATRTHSDGLAGSDRSVSLNFLMPLEAGRQTHVSGSYVSTPNGRDSKQLSVVGALSDEGNVSYNLSTSDSGGTASSSGGLNATLPFASVGLNLSQGAGIRQGSVSLAGGLVVADGIALYAPYVGETVAVVHAPGAAGAKVSYGLAPAINSKGYGLIPYLTPYAVNTVDLDLSAAPVATRFSTTVANVVPTSGAVVLVEFPESPGYSVFLRARLPGGQPLPFGAAVTNAEGVQVGNVGQAGRVELQLTNLNSLLSVEYGNGQKCELEISLKPPAQREASLVAPDMVCDAPTTSASQQPQLGVAGSANLGSADTTLQSGSKYLGILTLANGSFVPVGAQVQGQQSESVGVVARNGRVAVRVRPDSRGPLQAWWQDDTGAIESCEVGLPHAPTTSHAGACAVTWSKL